MQYRFYFFDITYTKKVPVVLKSTVRTRLNFPPNLPKYKCFTSLVIGAECSRRVVPPPRCPHADDRMMNPYDLVFALSLIVTELLYILILSIVLVHNLTQFESVFFFIMFDVTGGVASVGATPQWRNLGVGYLDRWDIPCLVIKTVRWVSCSKFTLGL